MAIDAQLIYCNLNLLLKQNKVKNCYFQVKEKRKSLYDIVFLFIHTFIYNLLLFNAFRSIFTEMSILFLI